MEEKWNGDKVNNIFNGSIALSSLCMVIITLFQVTNKRAVYYVDDCFVFTALGYLLSMLFSYFSCNRKEEYRLEKLSHILFIISLIMTFLSGVVLAIEL